MTQDSKPQKRRKPRRIIRRAESRGATGEFLAEQSIDYGLQGVKHGVTEITAGERMVLGVPFHEYR